jgi:hypothetical protein
MISSGTGHRYLAYTGANPGTKAACASTSPTLKRRLRRAGLVGRDIGGASVPLWRPDHVLQTQGDLREAAHIAGRKPETLLKKLNYTVDEIHVHQGLAKLVTLDARTDVTVPAGQVRDVGSWVDDETRPGVLRPAA